MQGRSFCRNKLLLGCLVVLQAGYGWTGNDLLERTNSSRDSDIECIYDSRSGYVTHQLDPDSNRGVGEHVHLLVEHRNVDTDDPPLAQIATAIDILNEAHPENQGSSHDNVQATLENCEQNAVSSLHVAKCNESTSDTELAFLIDEVIDQQHIDPFVNTVDEATNNVSSTVASMNSNSSIESECSTTSMDQQTYVVGNTSTLLFDDSLASMGMGGVINSESSTTSQNLQGYQLFSSSQFSINSFNSLSIIDSTNEQSAASPSIHRSTQFHYSNISDNSIHLGDSVEQSINQPFEGFQYPASPAVDTNFQSPSFTENNQTTDIIEDTPPSPTLPRPRWRFPSIHNRSDTMSIPEQLLPYHRSSTPIGTEYSPTSSINTSTHSTITDRNDPLFRPPSSIPRISDTMPPRRSTRLLNNWLDIINQSTDLGQPSTSADQQPSTSVPQPAMTSRTPPTASSGGAASTSSDEDSCGVCQDEILFASTVVPCYHRFHHACMAIWLHEYNGNICPMCREVVQQMRHENEDGSVTVESIARAPTGLQLAIQPQVPQMLHITLIIET